MFVLIPIILLAIAIIIVAIHYFKKDDTETGLLIILILPVILPVSGIVYLLSMLIMSAIFK